MSMKKNIDAFGLRLKAAELVAQINKHLNISKVCGDCFTDGCIDGCANYYGRIDGRDRSVCCGACAAHNGYFPSMLVNHMKQKYDFDDVCGFLGETSCKIPMEERSRKCNLFLCKSICDSDTDGYVSTLRMCSSVIEECNKIIICDANVDYGMLRAREGMIDKLMEEGIGIGSHIVYL